MKGQWAWRIHTKCLRKIWCTVALWFIQAHLTHDTAHKLVRYFAQICTHSVQICAQPAFVWINSAAGAQNYIYCVQKTEPLEISACIDVRICLFQSRIEPNLKNLLQIEPNPIIADLIRFDSIWVGIEYYLFTPKMGEIFLLFAPPKIRFEI